MFIKLSFIRLMLRHVYGIGAYCLVTVLNGFDIDR